MTSSHNYSPNESASNHYDHLIDISNLSVNFYTNEASVLAVRNVSFSICQGETLGLVGESGCGKSVTAFSILRLISPPGRIVSGEIMYQGRDILTLSEEHMRNFRGNEISMIFQEPMTALNPVFKVGFQIAEPIIGHLKTDKKTAWQMAEQLLDNVGIPDPGKRLHSYPHELSGGMRQRVMIAMALAASPSLLIADEPTTALDVTIQAQILELLLDLQKERKMTMLLITHDLGIVANIADRIAIMYAGEIAETGTVDQIFNNPLHPYTIGLFEAIPKISEHRERLKPIPGTVPAITSNPSSCVFYDRCFKRREECLRNSIQLIEKETGQWVRCIRA